MNTPPVGYVRQPRVAVEQVTGIGLVICWSGERLSPGEFPAEVQIAVGRRALVIGLGRRCSA
jgi:hypothetical protein